MQASIGPCKLELVTADLTSRQPTRASTRPQPAAERRVTGLSTGGGPSIMEETRRRYHKAVRTGRQWSPAGRLAAQYVIHGVGPVWKGGHSDEEAALASAYRRSLEVAGSRQCASIAFPSLSTGAYAYPLPRAARVALHTVAGYLRRNNEPELVRFVLFDDQSYTTYCNALTALLSEKHCG